MVSAMQIDGSTSKTIRNADLLFDWKLDVERLEREARAAVQSRRSNPWTLVEAECSQDLITAELDAALAHKERTEAVAQTIEHLTAWRMRVERVIRQLRSLPP